MTNLIIQGICGRMGHALVEKISARTDCRVVAGVDQMAALLAKEIGVPLLEIPPDYERYGKTAPLRRNTEIVALADLVVAFWDMYSRGTAHTISECIRQRVPIQVVPLPKEPTE